MKVLNYYKCKVRSPFSTTTANVGINYINNVLKYDNLSLISHNYFTT